ncbi:MAG: M20 aminoacylase family protein [Gammaproteobacteria bacterium]|nr:M20 aminoacylase family protein [Gammaproteobacteria bacterium]
MNKALIDKRIASLQEELTQIRRDIHAHPELGFEERRTSDLVAEKLQEYGLDVYRGIGRTGVVGVLKVGNDTRSVGLRADMDALPIIEANDFAHRSTVEGKMHACGHDGHTTMLLGAAKYLAETQNFAGQVIFIFQPAEEGIGGASAMIEDGLFQQFPCDSIFAMHNAPGLAVGHFAVRSGPMMAGGAFFDIDIEGKGAHGARPETSIDPVVVSSHLVVALQSIISRNTSPLDTAVLSVTQIHSGDAYNVIPQAARISGTVRAFSSQVMDHIEARMNELSTGVAASFGAEAKVDFRNMFAPTINDPVEADYAADICATIVSQENVVRKPPLIMASEDFSFMLQQVSGCYINIGNGDGESVCGVHNPGYEFNDQAIPYGVSFFANLVEKKLAKDADC